MIDDIIETYRCLISCRKNLPGMSLEDAFNNMAMEAIKKELEYLHALKDKGVDND